MTAATRLALAVGALTPLAIQTAAADWPVGVVRPPLSDAIQAVQGERYVPNEFFATTTHFNTDLDIELLADLNIHTVRLDFAHDLMQPEPGAPTFDAGNIVIHSADLGIANGLDQLALISHPAEWLRVEGSPDQFPSDEQLAAFEDFVYQIASKYKGRIRYWQAGNEPNMLAWKERYVTMLKALSRAVKRADPENKVVLCGFCGGIYRYPSTEPESLEMVYEYGGQDYFDVVASHPYTWPLMPEEGHCLETIARLHEVMARHGDAKPLWITELGWAGVEPSMLGYLEADFWHRHRSRPEEDQARALSRMYLMLSTIPWIERVYFFHLEQEAGYTSQIENPDCYMGLISQWMGGRIRPKDAYFAVKTVVEQIGGATYHERIELSDGLWALTYTRGDEATVALWTVGDDAVMTLGDVSMVTGVTSMVGSPVLIRGEDIPPAELLGADGQVAYAEDRPIDWDGPRTLRLSGRPLYVHAAAADLPALKAQLTAARIEPRG
jgi:hypothetical protein